jgi:uncharacterized membrane protein
VFHRNVLFGFLTILTTSLPARADEPDLRRPLRVLVFTSAPTREYQFLRSYLVNLTESKQVKLSLCIQPAPGVKEAREGVVQDVSPERLFRSFPAHLPYDTIVAIDPDWARLSDESSATLKKWVENGGGLILIAGPINTFELTRAAQADKYKPILDLYPVTLLDPRKIESEIDTSKPRRLLFPKAPGMQPFLKLDDKGKGPHAGWKEFFDDKKAEAKKDGQPERGFFSYYPVKNTKPNAVVLATLDDPKARLKDGKDQPYLVTMKLGKGRVTYLGSGESWRLRQHKLAFYQHFWRGLLAYSMPSE